MPRFLRIAASLVAPFMLAPAAAADHSFEFVAEHLPEVAMDNRFATLPLWSGVTPAGVWQLRCRARLRVPAAGR